MKFRFYRQLNEMDCGPTCLRMIAYYYGKHYNLDTLAQMAGFSREGVSLLGISETAERLGFRCRGARLTFTQIQQVDGPCILHWGQHHFVVLIDADGGRGKRMIQVADPAVGIVFYTKEEFLQHWSSGINDNNEEYGVVLLLEPTLKFHEAPGEKEQQLGWGIIMRYLTQSRWQIIQVLLTLLFSSVIQLLFPFITQSIVDTGINSKNLQYVTIILIAQVMLLLSKAVAEFIRSRLLLRISNMLNLSILSDFWIKLTHLPISYFDAHHTGDTLQRIGDHKKIESFMTGTALQTFFSLFNFFIFATVLIIYNFSLFLIFTAGSVLYFAWVQLFLRIRRKLNYQLFHIAAKENNTTLQFIQGMTEIKLNSAEQLKRWEWENIQATIFNLQFKSLSYNQWQQAGALLINQGKDVVITFMVALLVINGKLTLGAMLAVQYIIGQLSNPIEQFVGFMQSAQDAKISMERLNEIHQLPDEEPEDKSFITTLPSNKSITLNNVTFAYPGAGNDPVLKNISLQIPVGKVTAIVGSSGSGKTTLLKLLLKSYETYNGEVLVGNSNLRYIGPSFWRKQCGAVLQDGFIFNDTIARNIAVGDESPDFRKLIQACTTANILSFIESLPNGFYTKLGVDGTGISQGQKQRILIARAVYKDPEYLLFDEATNALDAKNERLIVEALDRFFEGKTVVVVAHRLSTVKDADNIIVMEHGEIAEQGTHAALIARQGRYFDLVRTQLELSN